MSNKYFVPLQEIEKAIRINCQIDHNAFKALTLVKDTNNKNQGVGRSIFIYVALKLGYDKEKICDYLGITSTEYESKAAVLQKMHTTGKYLFTKKVEVGAMDDTSLLFYRKLLLVSNYLRYKYRYEL